MISVVIIGIIGAIALPRLSRGASGSAEAALRQDLSVLRSAIDLFTTEHCGIHPTDASTLVDQLTLCSDAAGNTSATPTASHIYGPYIRSMPALPVGKNKGSAEIRGNGQPGSGHQGWFYDKATAQIVASTKDTETDEQGTKYNEY